MFFTDAARTKKALEGIVKEHCDGNRNIVHMTVAMCVPTSNKDYDSGGHVLHLQIV